VDNRFYLQALGVTGLFIGLLFLFWIASGGPADEAQIRNANNTRTAIAMTGSYLLQPRTRTPTPFIIIPNFTPQTQSSGSPSVPVPTDTAATPLPLQTVTATSLLAPSLTPLPTQTAIVQAPAVTTPASPGRPSTKAPPLLPPAGTITYAQDPAEFARWYFTRVWNERDYQNLWDNYLTPSFKANAGSGLFEDYAGWWNSVERVDVKAADVIENNGRDAWVRVNLTFHMQDGRVVRDQIYDYDFLYDSTSKTWMFDSGP
jgi:hypothetical protein